MHELGVIINVVKKVEDFAAKNGVAKIDTLVLQIGELSPMIPRYVEACYPAAVDGTIMEETKLKIEILPANAICSNCKKVFNVILNKKQCPHCKSHECEIISGREFFIKEIIAC